MVWKKGESGNPKGKPIGTTSFKTDFDRVVKEIAKLNHISEIDARMILLKKAYSEAKDGNFPYYKDIIDRYYGKPVENVDVKSGGERIGLFDYVTNRKHDSNQQTTEINKEASGNSRGDISE